MRAQFKKPYVRKSRAGRTRPAPKTSKAVTQLVKRVVRGQLETKFVTSSQYGQGSIAVYQRSEI